MFPVRREKDNKAQTLKLLKAVQGRLGNGNGAGGVLMDIGGENDLVRVAPKVNCIVGVLFIWSELCDYFVFYPHRGSSCVFLLRAIV